MSFVFQSASFTMKEEKINNQTCRTSTAVLLIHNTEGSSKSQGASAKAGRETLCQVILAHFAFRLLSTGASGKKVHSVLYLTLS